ncbi:hypothetical protein [Alcanivorax sp. 1008]|uniref:hypothetical protein n=1 Tax=Alcanivorax sp. 1008 TaxID=2816853 RepID=UPI001D99E063|nr:hypothetical protein [Alcanivorax sp. 1008]MCC1498346.1 hypothetical protein [Alcanivorax sp. 1008]
MRVLLLLIILMVPMGAGASDYVVVVSKDSPIDFVDGSKVKSIFLKQRKLYGKARLIPVNLVGSKSPRPLFEERVLLMSREEINNYWIRGHFEGLTPPATQASLESIKQFVKTVEGAIGYLPKSMLDPGLKVVHEF